MGIDFTYDQDGNAIKKPTPAQEAGTAKEKPKKEKAESDWSIAERAVRSFSMPVAFLAGVMWGYHRDRGWTDQTHAFLTHCHKLRGRNARSSVYEIVADKLAIPNNPSVLYWEREGEDLWGGTWVPFRVAPEQILYSDVLLNVMTDEVTPLDGRTIYGPMITLPWENETGDDPVCEEFEALIENALPNLEVRRHFQEMAGLILQPHAHLRGEIVLWGEPHTGKSTVAAAIACAPAGMHGAAFVTEDRLTHDKWSSVALVGKFVAVSNDSELSPKWEAFLKCYTSGDLVVEPKFRQPSNVSVTAKLFATCNQMQSLSDPSGAGGMRLYPFKIQNPIPISGDPSQPNLGLPRYWCHPKRRAGVVQWLLVGLERLRARGLFAEPADYMGEREEALAEANPLEAWVKDCLKKEDKGWVRLAEIVQAMPTDIHEGTPRGLETKVGTLIQRIFGIKASRKTVAGVQQRGYAGLSLKEGYEE